MINKDLYMMKVADAEPFGGGVAGMLAGRELLHSTMPEIGAIGIVGGAALGAKNIYGLYNDYFD